MQFLILVLLLLAPAAAAQQANNQDFLQKAVTSLQTQRNVALDQLAIVEAKAAMLAEENAKLKAQIEELQKQLSVKSGEQQKP